MRKRNYYDVTNVIIMTLAGRLKKPVRSYVFVRLLSLARRLDIKLFRLSFTGRVPNYTIRKQTFLTLVLF